MDNVKEEIRFTYTFCDRDDGTMHTVTNSKVKECVLANELCEMFLDFMRSAGYSEENVFDYFNEADE